VLSSRARLERVQRDVEELDVAARCRLLPGELAAGSIPGEADCYLLRRVLTRLDDSAARTVLQSVRRALSAGSRLLLCEAPLGAGVLALQSEQYELALGRGRVRDVSELSALCADSGLGIERVERDAELVLFVLRAS
jgi:hypothetical protein